MKNIIFAISLMMVSTAALAVDCFNIGMGPQERRMDDTLFNLDEVLGYKFYSDRNLDGIYQEENFLLADGPVTVFCIPQQNSVFAVGVSLYDKDGTESERNYFIVPVLGAPQVGELAEPRAPGFACTGAEC